MLDNFYTLRLLFIPDPDINLLIIISTLSCFCLICGVSAFCPAYPFLIFLSLSIIKSPDFSDIFLPSRSPAFEIPDLTVFFTKGLVNFFYNTLHRFENIINNNSRPFMLIYKFAKRWMIKSLEFIWFHYNIMLHYLFLFRSNEKDVSAPFRLINLLFPSVIYILMLLILFLLVGLNVTLFGSRVNE